MIASGTEHLDADVAIVGSGFAGALMALALRRRGRRVALLERGRHPRFAIGESSTPLAGLLLEELADRYDLPRIRVFSKWGTWQQARPDVGGGLKRGFSFFFHRAGERFEDNPEHRHQMLVAASPHDEVGDAHWYRQDIDQALVREAEREGAIYLDEARLERLSDRGPLATLEGTRRGRPLRVTARFVVDASGPRGFIHRALDAPEAPTRWMLPTAGLYTHFEGVAPWHRPGSSDETPPYPPDAAALHHVFPGGWIWVLRFANGVTSAGAALTSPVAAAVAAADGAPAWDRLLAMLPSVRDQFEGARPIRPFVYAPRLAFRSRVIHGRRWAMLPSAAGVIDPLLSTGFPLTLLGIARLLELLEETGEGRERQAALAAYARTTQAELDAAERLIAALYAAMHDVPLFKKLALLYFAAASYSESARRLGKRELAPGFLLRAHPRFGRELRACAAAALQALRGSARDGLLRRVDRAIEPFDIAGLLKRERRHWYPVLAGDLQAGASKLDASSEEIDRLLERCGFVREVSGRGARSATSR